MEPAWIEGVRSFNRTVAERVGALNDHFLGRDRPVGEARLLWEIGIGGADIRDLRARLSLDSAYVSRLLRSLEQQRLVDVADRPHDRRVRRAVLTDAGLAERAEYDRRSNDLARRFLQPLTDKQRARVVAAMAEVERLLTASIVTVSVANPAAPDARACVAHYFAELETRFEAGFDSARSISAGDHELMPPAGVFLVARLRESPVACGAVKLHDNAPAELKRMWVAPPVRGLGVGSRLLGELERHARSAGARVVRLETNRALKEAIALYRANGYREVAPFNAEPYAHHWFEKRLA
ncbi:MAG TPA: helix-turn-helix domain-containing GNAT family N-acetyltransferase [Casimicrobiaceae bacterium]|jgi:DNA-binding MarR family transcriptional regulator